MNDTAFNLGLLKGFVIAKDAPKEILSAIDALRAASLEVRESVGYAGVQIPKVDSADLAALILKNAPTAPSHDEARFNPPETAQPEANDDMHATGEAGEGEEAHVSTGGALRAKGNAAKLGVEMLPAIETALAAKSFAQVGADYGVTGQSIVNFLKRHGVDHKQFKKMAGVRPKAVEDDAWPEAAKSEKTAPLTAPVTTTEQPRMKFKTVRVKRGWGQADIDVQIPQPSGKYKDPETGAKVTTYPPGYAIGTGPQRNIKVKGGS